MRSPSSPREIRFPAGWGGRRAGAGREPGRSPRVAHLRRARFASRHPCHVTLKVRNDVPSLRTATLVRELERSFRDSCERGDFRLVHYTIQSNHLHLVVEAAGTEALSRGMKSIGARVARAVNRVFGRRGPVLSDRYQMRPLKTPREVRNALAYVLLNGRRHSGRPSRVARMLDPASSGRWFDGWRRAPAPARDAPAVATPHTWLLQTAWR